MSAAINIKSAWLLRLPMLLVSLFLLSLYLGLPYRSLDSDVAIFGLMGEDLYHLGYLPTLTYGQNYIYSVTPYLYALFRIIMPADTPSPVILALAGSVLTLTGLWLVYESFLAVWRRSTAPHSAAPWIFCILLLASPLYILDLSRNSSIELSTFTLGGLMFAASRIWVALDQNKRPASIWWLLAGMVFSYAAYSRPQICLVGFFLLLPLLYRVARQTSRSASRHATIWLIAGGVIGYLPLLLHQLLRAPFWPSPRVLATHLNSWHAVRHAGGILFGQILPAIFGLDPTKPVTTAIIGFWLFCGIIGLVFFLRRQRKETTILDFAWVGGFLALLLVMVLESNLTHNATNRRYCLHIYLAAVWLFCRFAVRLGWHKYALALVAVLCLLALPRWNEMLRAEWQDNAWTKEAQERLVPELRAQQAVILANYWDAYLLAFLARGQLTIEAVPWDWVRTYGLINKAQMQKKALWFVRAGYGHATADHLLSYFGPEALQHKRDIALKTTFWGNACELWELQDNNRVVALMEKLHPRYFSTPYPPGSGRDLRKTP